MTVQNLTPHQAYELLQKTPDLFVLDVRTPEEFEMFLIEGAINIDIEEAGFETETGALQRHIPYLIYCHSGVRSEKAVNILISQGFERLYHLEGGLREWAYLDLPHIYNHSL